MQGVLTAETAILVELKTIGVVLLVLERIVVPLLAFGAGKCDLYAHGFFLLKDCGSNDRGYYFGLPLIQPDFIQAK
jgi:hypothetical protein